MALLLERRPERGPIIPVPRPSSFTVRGRIPLDGVLAAVAVLSVLVVGLDLQVPVLRPLAGLLLLFLLPTYLVFTNKHWVRSSPYEAVLCAFTLVLLGVILLGLALNSLLPLVSVTRPLDRLPVLFGVAVAVAALGGWRRSRWRREPTFGSEMREFNRPLRREDKAVVAAAGLLVGLAVVGAIRLNNGAGPGVTIAMLTLAALVVLVLIGRGRSLHAVVPIAGFYLLALAMLLMTSLRGWGVSGHDSQIEFYVFQLTQNSGIWRMEAFQNAYNACLSITVLPTMISGLTGVSGTYVFKAIYPLVLAVCPVIVYLIARRFGSVLIATLSAVYFVGFPTFFTDMPFLNRQAIAFVFLGMVFLVVTNHRWAVQRRQMWVAAFSVGVVLSHYSSTYVLIGLFVIALGVRLTVGLVERVLTRRGRRVRGAGRGRLIVVGPVNIALLAAMALVWTGPITHSGGQVEQTASRLGAALFGGGSGVQSSDVAYSLLPQPVPPPEERLASFEEETLAETADARADGVYYPLATVQRYPTPIAEAEDLPLTGLGQFLRGLGLDVEALNTVVRQGVARLLQVFVGVGFLFVMLRRARGIYVSRELFFLAVAAFLVVLAQVVLPAVSVDYGLLRAFQQALYVLAPFLAVGSVHVFGWLGARRAVLAATVTAVVFFVSLTGLLPQSLGGYPPQLHLNNSGAYYDLYYPQPQESAAADWLEERAVAQGSAFIQTEIPGRLLYGRPPDIQVQRSVFPEIVQQNAYVLLGDTVVNRGRTTLSYDGDLLTYEYPIEFLDGEKDLVYSSSGARIYR